MFGHAMTSF